MVYSVQYLRGFAALLVVISHVFTKINQLSGYSGDWFSVGPAGVDLFFIISGFIMCKATERRSISPVAFMLARAKRILPLYWILTFIALLIFMARPDLVNSSGGVTTVLHSFTLLPIGEKLLIQNGWTLSFEFLFYGLFAISIAISFKERLRYTLAGLVLLASAGLIFDPTSPELRFITSTLLLEFAMGMLAFLYLKHCSNFRLINGSIMLLGLIGLYVLSEYYEDLPRVVSFGLPMFAIFVGFVSFESSIEKYKNNRMLWPLKALGDSSYSLYLFHAFTLALTAVIIRSLHLQHNIVTSSLLLMSAALVSGYVCYVFLEVPLSRLVNAGNRPVGAPAA